MTPRHQKVQTLKRLKDDHKRARWDPNFLKWPELKVTHPLFHRLVDQGDSNDNINETKKWWQYRQSLKRQTWLAVGWRLALLVKCPTPTLPLLVTDDSLARSRKFLSESGHLDLLLRHSLLLGRGFGRGHGFDCGHSLTLKSQISNLCREEANPIATKSNP